MTTDRTALLADKYIGRNGEQPAIKLSIQRLQCSACGVEANASCNCGKPYVPAQKRVAEYDKANPGRSTRKAAADLGVSKSEVSRARQAVPSGTPETVTGIDGKQYPATKPKAASITLEGDMSSPDEDSTDEDHEEGLRVIAARGLLNRAAEARGLADLGRLQNRDVTESMIVAAERAAAAWNDAALKLPPKADMDGYSPNVR